MSARKISSAALRSPGQLTVRARQSQLTLPADSFVIHRGGIEFRSETSFPKWVEMTVTLQSPQDGGVVNCSGVVVDCAGNRHAGYHVSMVFTDLTKREESQLSQMAVAQLR